MNPPSLLLGAILAALPLATVQSASPQISVNPLEARTADGADLLRIRVVDADTGAAIPEFLVILGVELAIQVEKEFAERHPGEEVVNWQPHTAQPGRDGSWERSLARAYDPMAVRVEATGYVPLRHLWFDKKRGSQELTFRLTADPGIKGRVSLPDGKPAAGAVLGIALVQRNLRIEGSSFAGFGEPEADKPGDRWRRPTMVVADDQGHFTLPRETDPASAAVAVHEGGIAQMFYADFAAAPEITLSKWGGVAGTVTLGDKPGEGVEVTFSIQHYGYGYPDMVAQGGVVHTDAAGTFSFAKVAPGLVQVSLFEFFPKSDPDSFRGSFLRPPASAFTHLTVLPGEVGKVSLGGKDLAPPRATP